MLKQAIMNFKQDLQKNLLWIAIYNIVDFGVIRTTPVIKRFHKRIPIEIFWPLLGLLSYGLAFLLLNILGERNYWPSEFLVLVGSSMLIVMHIRWQKPLRNILKEFTSVTNLNEPETWVDEKMLQIFTFKSVTSRVIIFGFMVGLLWLVASFPLPYSPAFNILGTIALIPVAFIGGHGLYMATRLYILIHEMSKQEIKNDKLDQKFYLIPHPITQNIYLYYVNNFSVSMIIAYLWLLGTVITSPYRSNFIFSFILIILAFYPFPVFVWAYLKTSQISIKIKRAYISIINNRVNECFLDAQKNNTPEKLEILSKWMDIQDRVEKLNPYPFRLGAIFYAGFAATATLLQIALSIYDLLKL